MIAEGPESALSIRQATGYETWAVFGVSGWKSAPVPSGREVIFAPDRDAPDSPAGRAFRAAVAHHVAAGCAIRIAVAPEPVGSKRDLNDTLMRAGAAAVRAAIASARGVGRLVSPALNPGQRRAAEAMLSSARLTLVKGHAGTGKTHTLGEVARVWRSRGIGVLGGAPSGKATQELAGIAGLDAATLSAWEARWSRGDRPPAGEFVFIMDEAGMVGLAQWSRLQSQIAAMGGKLIAIGDPEQLQPVSDLSGWAVAEARLGEVVVMDRIVRQRDAGDRRATEALARGGAGIAAGIRHYAQKGAVRLEADVLADPLTAVAQAYFAGGAVRDRSRIALACTRRDVHALNHAIRSEALARCVVARGGARRYGIERIIREEEHSRRETVQLDIGSGDRIVLTRAHRELGLARSAFGTVTAAGEARIGVLMDGAAASVEIDPGGFPYFDYGYATTIHKSQGMTVDDAFVLPHRLLDRHGVYVALSRHRDSVTVFGRAGHLESVRSLCNMALRTDGRLAAPPDGRANGALTPCPAADTVRARVDWTGPVSPVPARSFAGDRHLMAVAGRVGGLLAADHTDSDGALKGDVADPRDDAPDPCRAVEALVARQSVFCADEIAGLLSMPVSDPETFLRLFREAMSHPDLVALPTGGSAPASEPWVYTTGRQLRAELAAVDRGMRLAARAPGAPGAPGADSSASGPSGPAVAPDMASELTREQRAALDHALAPGGVRIVRGGTGSGKTRVAAAAAAALARAGRAVVVVSPTEAGRAALASESASAVTLGAFLANPVEAARPGAPERVVILDDAHSLGIGRADVFLARIEATGSRLVAFVNPGRRPTDAGPVFRALGDRLGAAALTGVHGQDGALADMARGLRAGVRDAVSALEALKASGLVRAEGGMEAALARLARDYVADRSGDRIALAWSRAQVEAVTAAIRARLDATDRRRAAFAPALYGPLAGLQPGDRIRFVAGGAYGSMATGGAAASRTAAGLPRSPVRRGEMAAVLGRGGDGCLELRVRGPDGVREIAVAPEGPLPNWRFAFAGTIAGEAGLRHESVHLLVAPGMDREVLTAGALAARSALRLVLPVASERCSKALGIIVGRERRARSGLDHGFDASRAAEAASRAAAAPAFADPGLAAAFGDGGPGMPGTDLTAVPRIGRRDAAVRAANAAFLRDHPDQILAVVQTDRPVFTQADIRHGLRARLGGALSEGDLRGMGDRVMASDELVMLGERAPDGAPQYVTVARAGLMRRCAQDAQALAAGTFAPAAQAVVRAADVHVLNATQGLAAEAMLGAARLTLVTGHAGTGKTHTLREVTRVWRDRGVTVLAGAPSGRATAELSALDGAGIATLAAWEARWARGELPPAGRFVFIMDEAGMVGAGQWSRLQAQVAAMGGKLIAVGDPEQLQPVSDLSGWALAEQAAGMSHMIDTVIRQRNMMDGQATEALARGGAGIAAAIGYYAQKGAVRLEPEVLADPFTALAQAYCADRDPGRSRIALAYTNHDVHALNSAIRSQALACGMVERDGVQRYGEIERIVRSGGVVKRVRVPLALGVGDRIMLTRPHPASGLARSSFGTVTAVHRRRIEVRFDGGEGRPGGARPVTIDMESFRDIDYGYATTIHKSQGMTVDDAFVLPHRLMHRHGVYVALSRHRENVTVFGRAGHLGGAADLVELAQAPGHLSVDLPDGPAGWSPGMAPGADTVVPGAREDWRSRGSTARPVGFSGDADLMATAERVVGLLAAEYSPGAAILRDDPRGHALDPRRVIDDLMARCSVIRAGDVAGRLAQVVAEPETFLRLFRGAMSHPDLVALSEAGVGGDGRVYSTGAQIRAELEAVDCGARLGLSGAPAGAPTVTLSGLARRDRRLEEALEQSLDASQQRGARSRAGPRSLASDPRGCGQRQDPGRGAGVVVA